MPGQGDSSWKAWRAGRWRSARQAVWAVAAVGLLALAASGEQASDPTVMRILVELQSLEDEPLTIAVAQARAGDAVGARVTLQRAFTQAKDARSLLAIEKIQAEMGDQDAALKTLLMARKSHLIEPTPHINQVPTLDGHAEPPLDLKFEARIANRHISETLADIAIEQSRLGDRVAADATFEHAMRSARTLMPDDRSQAIAHVIWARAKAGDFDAALKEVASLGDRSEWCEALTSIEVREGIVEMKVLVRILGMIDTSGIFPEDPALSKKRVIKMKIETLIAMALAQAAANDRGEAGKTLQKVRQTAQALEEEDERYNSLREIATALVKIGDTAEASRMSDFIGKTERNWKGAILTAIAEAHSAIGDPANRKAWDEALRAAQTDTEKVRILFEIAAAQTKAGDRDAALRTLEQAQVVEHNMNQVELEQGPLMGRNLVEMNIAEARAKAGDIAGAIRLANTINHTQIRGAALATIAAVQADSGDIKGALQTAETSLPLDPGQRLVNHLWDQRDALHQIITIQARTGDVAGALATIDRLGPTREWRRQGLVWITEGLGRRNDAGKRAQPPRKP